MDKIWIEKIKLIYLYKEIQLVYQNISYGRRKTSEGISQF
jgi:hypothetical protein